MALVPFGNPKAAPNRSGTGPRTPEQQRTGAQKTNPIASGTNRGRGMPAPPVDGALVTHDTRYPRRKPYEQR